MPGKYAKTKNYDNSTIQIPQNDQHYCYDNGKQIILTRPFKLGNLALFQETDLARQVCKDNKSQNLFQQIQSFFPGNRLCSASMKRKRDPDNLFLNSTWMNLSKSQLTFVSPS